MDFSKLMSAAGDLRGRLEEAQRQARESRYVGEAGGGLVRITMNGNFEVLDVSIDLKAVTPDSTALLEDLVRAACNQCIGHIQESLKGQLGSMAVGMGLGLPT